MKQAFILRPDSLVVNNTRDVTQNNADTTQVHKSYNADTIQIYKRYNTDTIRDTCVDTI